MHPGQFVKDHLNRLNISLSKAADILGVGRPTLSRFLNGRASLSKEMAAKLKRAFDLSPEDLFSLQSKYDDLKNNNKLSTEDVAPYTPCIIESIKANEITLWSSVNIEPRRLLAALLRRLIQESNVVVSNILFPAHDNSETPGFDGYLDTESRSKWIPKGKSKWEFSVTKNYKKKFKTDFEDSLGKLEKTDRLNEVLILVSTQSVVKKAELENYYSAKDEWKAVKIYDSKVLEEWLENTIVTSLWLAEKMGKTISASTLTFNNEVWSFETDPPLSENLFNDHVRTYSDKLNGRLGKTDHRPLIITASNLYEGCAFLHSFLLSDNNKSSLRIEQIPVISTEQDVQKLANISTRHTLVISGKEIQKNSTHLLENHNLIFIMPHDPFVRPDIIISFTTSYCMSTALKEMGHSQNQADKIIHECGRSLSVLRRNLSKNPLASSLAWLNNPEQTSLVLNLSIIGRVNLNYSGDIEILELLNDQKIDSLFSEYKKLSSLENPPVWVEGKVLGVSSIYDSLFLLKEHLTFDVIEKSLNIAYNVLNTDNPLFEVPKEYRWWHAILSPNNSSYSSILTKALCEVMNVLSNHTHKWNGYNLADRITKSTNELIELLLMGNKDSMWFSRKEHLVDFAQIAPDILLASIESAIQKSDTNFLALFESVPSDRIFFGSADRVNIVAALEILSWNEKNFKRSSEVLCELAAIPISDNIANTPLNTLKALFRWWNPQTYVSVEKLYTQLIRLNALRPDVGWQIIQGILSQHNRSGIQSRKPTWDHLGIEKSINNFRKKLISYRLKVLDFVLNNEFIFQERFEFILSICKHLPKDQFELFLHKTSKLIFIIKDDALRKSSIKDQLRKTISGFNENDNIDRRSKLVELFEIIEIQDVFHANKWLFTNRWVNPKLIKEKSKNKWSEEVQQELYELRKKAILEILERKSLLEMLDTSGCQVEIGKILAEIKSTEVLNFLYSNYRELYTRKDIDSFWKGVLYRFDLGTIKPIFENLNDQEKLVILLNIRYNTTLTELLKPISTALRVEFWENVVFHYFQDSSTALLVSSHFEAHGRIYDAIWILENHLKEISTERIIHLLSSFVSSENSNSKFQPELHVIEMCFNSLYDRDDCSWEQIAQLELMYLLIIEGGGELRAVSKLICSNPEYLVELDRLTKNKQEDESEARTKFRIRLDSYLLNGFEEIPGFEEGQNDVDYLIKWIEKFEQLDLSDTERKTAEGHIGEILSRTPNGEDNVWPIPELRHYIDQIDNLGILSGIRYSHRIGSGFRASNGKPERRIAKRFTQYEEALNEEFPNLGDLMSNIASDYFERAEAEDRRDSLFRRLN